MSSTNPGAPSAPKPKAPPPRRAQPTNNPPAEDILTGPTIRKRAVKAKSEEPLLGTMSVAFSAPVRENVSAGRRPPPVSSGMGGSGPGAAGGRGINKNVGMARAGMGLISDEDAYKNEFHDEELHYPPVTVPFQPPNDDTAAWYEQFASSDFGGIDFDGEMPQLPAYRDPSYADQIDPKFTTPAGDSTKVEGSNGMGDGDDDGEGSIVYGDAIVNDVGSIYFGLPLWKDPSKEVYMVPKLHSAGNVLTYKDILAREADAVKNEASATTTTTTTTTKAATTSGTKMSDDTSSTADVSDGDPHLRRDVNPNLSFIQLPPILHLSGKEPSARGLSQTDGIYIPEGSHLSYNVNGSTSKAEDVAKLGLLNRTRHLQHHGRVGELEIYESGIVFLVIGNQRFLIQKGPEVLMRQDLINIKPHPFNPQQPPQPSSTTTTTTTTTAPTTTTTTTATTNPNMSHLDQLSADTGLLHQTTVDQEFVMYNMGHIDHHLIASIDIGDMINNAPSR